MRKKVLLFFSLVLLLVLLPATPSLAYIGWNNCIWLGVDLEQEYQKMGYFHQDEVLTRVVSEYKVGDVPSFDISLSNTFIKFQEYSGLYGELGLNSRDGLNILFGAGYTYINKQADFFLTIGTKYYMQDETLVNELQVFYRVFPPFVVNLGYDDYAKKAYVGLGLAYR